MAQFLADRATTDELDRIRDFLVCVERRMTQLETVSPAFAREADMQAVLVSALEGVLRDDHALLDRAAASLVEGATARDRAWLLARPDHLVIPHSSLELPLTLDRPEDDLDLDHLSRLLRPHNSLIPITGRDEELAALGRWRDSPASFGWHVLTGAGGLGKTRLAQEFARASRGHHWLAGFLNEQPLAQVIAHDEFLQWAPEADTLIVIDYAEGAAKRAPLERLLARLARWSLDNRDEPSARARVLLLARQGQAGEGWLGELAQCAEGQERDQLRAALTPPLSLSAPGSSDTLDTLGQVARETFAAWQRLHPGRRAPGVTIAESDLEHLQRVTLGRPLYAQTAAWMACELGDTSGLGRWASKDLLDYAVEKENLYINQAVSAGPDREIVKRGAALLTILGPQAREDPGWLKILAEEGVGLGYPLVNPGTSADTILRLHKDAPQGNHSLAAPITPDLLGEAFTVRVLEERPHLVVQSLHRVLQQGGTSAWGRFLRLVSDLARVESYDVGKDWLAELADRLDTKELASAAPALPDRTVVLRDFAVRCVEAQVQVARDLDEPVLAMSLNNLGNRYSDLGRLEQALEVTAEATEIYRRLVAALPGAFEPDLARSLNNLGNRYSSLGRYEQALEATQEAVEMRRRLAAAYPDAFEPGLAMTLGNLGNHYTDLGCREEALQATEEASEIYARLARERPDVFESNQAECLSNLGIRLRALGRRQAAFEVTLTATEMFRNLAAACPDPFELGLAGCLTNLGNCCLDLGRREQGLEVIEEAVEIHRRLVSAHPDTFESGLAMSLDIFATCCTRVGRKEAALVAGEEAVKAYRSLAAARPEIFEPALARCLANLATRLSDVGRREEALEAAEMATGMHVRLAAAQPNAFEPDLASSLNILGNRHGALGHREEALECTETAVEILRRLAAARPEIFEPDLALSLDNLGIRYLGVGRREEALETAEAATQMYRCLATAQPEAFEPCLARCLTNLGNCYREVGSSHEACGVSEEAVGIRRRLAAAHSEAFEASLAMSLDMLGVNYRELGVHGEALHVTEEAVGIYRRLVTLYPGALEPELARSLDHLGTCLSELGRRGDAHEAATEAVEMYRRLVDMHPLAFEPDLAMSLNNLGACKNALGHIEDAVNAAIEAVQIYRRQAKDRPEVFEAFLVMSLNNLGVHLSEVGRQQEAQQAWLEAAEIRTRRG